MALRKDTLITDDGGLHQLGDGYVDWRVGESKVVLDGRFTIADLQWLIDHMRSGTMNGIQPKKLSRTELLRLFDALYDVTMPLAYVEAVEAVFGHLKTCCRIGQAGSITDFHFYNRVLTDAEIQHKVIEGQ